MLAEEQHYRRLCWPLSQSFTEQSSRRHYKTKQFKPQINIKEELQHAVNGALKGQVVQTKSLHPSC